MKPTAAGIIVFRNNNNNPEFLGLIAPKKERKRAKGVYDVPKGHIEPLELEKEAAHRECLEESGLYPKIVGEPFTEGRLIVWLGEVDSDSEIVIEKNPTTGYLEHEGYEWLKPSELKDKCLNYLRPHAIWAEKEVWKYFKF